MNFRFLSLSLALLFCVSICGCGGQQLPPDLPKLFPCKIKVTMDGAPVQSATIMLADEGNSKWGASGITNAEGEATIKTGGQYPGAPAGTYKVLITKSEAPQMPENAPENYAPKITYFVDEKFGNITSAPHSITIADKAINETFEVSAPKK